ncbi:hypothetical protein RRG08_019228 [Elysia crispata]|uniref:Uncharacterized protein n=1 Tax=Elysia crispata TaxID=231223 RepID=A0AAE1ATA1_9GAST|nr:hypothetical protein RRG08_019228 [Elysia crispata]
MLQQGGEYNQELDLERIDTRRRANTQENQQQMDRCRSTAVKGGKSCAGNSGLRLNTFGRAYCTYHTGEFAFIYDKRNN